MDVIVDGYCWVDLKEMSEQQAQNVKNMLTIYPRKTTDIAVQEKPPPIYLYKEFEERNLLGVPREFYRKKATVDNREILKVSYGSPMRELKSTWKAHGPYKEQAVALDMLDEALEGKKWGGVFLNAGCAFGKTACGIEFARRRGCRTLIMVHKDFLITQWVKRIKNFLPDAVVGIIKQKRCEYEETKSGEKPDFVIASMQSLAKDEGDRYPKKMYKAFGTVISDECHRMGAATWAPLMPRFTAAWRLGLTATARRKDGAADVFFQHISPITYAARTEGQRPHLRRLFTECKLSDIQRGDYYVGVSDLNSAQIISQVAGDDFRSRAIIEELVEAVKIGRKIMIVSERLLHLKAMAETMGTMLFDADLPWAPTIDYYVGSWFTGEVYDKTIRNKNGKILHRRGELKTKPRKQVDLDKAEEAQVIFATKQECEEALDIQAVDVIALATPMSDIEQVVGRGRRWCTPEPEKCKRLCSWRAGKCKGKPQLIVFDVFDDEIENLNSKSRARTRFYKKVGAL